MDSLIKQIAADSGKDILETLERADRIKKAAHNKLDTYGPFVFAYLCGEIGLREAARRLGQSPANVSAVKSGKRRLGPTMLKQVMELISSLPEEPGIGPEEIF